MLNKKGSFLIDAMLALMLTSIMALLLQSAFLAYTNSLKKERKQDDIFTIQEEARRLYDD